MRLVSVLALVTALSLQAHMDEIARENSPAEPVEVNIINNNNHSIEVHNERKDVCDCTAFFGDQFKQCMRYVSKDCFKKNIQSLDPRVCKHYVFDLSMKEVAALRASFTHEEWGDLRQHCSLFAQLIEDRIADDCKNKEEYRKDTNKAIGLTLLGLLFFACK